MSTFKRSISLLLAMIVLVGVFAPVTQAAPAEETASVNTDNVTIEGTNGFGNLLSQEITESQEEAESAEAEYPGGYTVTDVVIEGNTATVTYDTMEEATLVVALYTEDGMQLVTSANVEVTPDVTTATVAFGEDMPEYFLASAYLLDSYDLSPLCAAYDTPMYTREMQKLLASTVDDYDPEKVLNLDEDETTNFAVYADSTIVIEAVEGKNIVASIDNENATYVIKNANEQITSLVEGNVFVYPYEGNEILIVKIAAIAIDGTTATITGSELEMAEAFAYMKIEGTGENEDIVVDDSTAGEGITYVGLIEDENGGIGPQAVEGGDTKTMRHQFELNIGTKADSGQTSASLTVTGTLDLTLTTTLKYYLSASRKYIAFTTATNIVYALGVHDELVLYDKLGHLAIPIAPGVKVGFEPELQLRFEGKMDLKTTVASIVGFQYDNGSGFRNLSQKPEVGIDLDVEGTIFLGIDLCPQIELIDDSVAEIEANILVGVELKASACGTFYEIYSSDSDEKHLCRECIDMDVHFKVKIGGSLRFLDQDWLSVGITIKEWTPSLGKMYYSFDNKEFGVGTCPNRVYRVTVQVKDKEYNPIPGETVTVSTLNEALTTDENGLAVFYTPEDEIIVRAEKDGYFSAENVKINKARKIVLCLVYQLDGGDNGGTGGNSDSGNPFEGIDFGGVEDSGNEEASGTCGDNLTWTLYSSGKLVIEGTGEMPDWNAANEVPWHNLRDNIICAEVGDGITYINHYAFEDCSNMISYTIGKDVSSFWASGVSGCTKLEKILVDEENVIYSSIDGVLFSKDHTILEDYPIGIKNDRYIIPVGVTWIEANAFTECYGLDEIIIPNSVVTIAPIAFGNCGLVSLEIPDSVTFIGNSAFASCKNLQNVVIGSGVEKVKNAAFDECYNLTQITFLGNSPEFGKNIFREVTATVYYPAANPTWTTDVMQNYGGTITWVPYTPSEGNSIIGELTEIAVQKPTVEIEAVYGGEYDTDITEEATIKTASFDDLVPGEQYVMLAMVSMEGEDPLSDENLLGIAQGVADEDGALSFRYIQRTPYDVSYVVVCGASNKNLRDAVITFPDMMEDGQHHVVEPTVVYDGETLTEGRDYVIVGTVDFTDAGTYTCFIRGIHNYTGLVECSYTIGQRENPFNDVALGSFYYEPVMWAVKNGVTSGTSETTFDPSGLCLRAHVVTFLYRAAGSPVPSSTQNPFTDVKSGDFFYKPVLWAVENGITQGISKTQFGSTQVCNRAAVVTFLWRAFGSPEPKSTNNPFVDVKSTDFFYMPVLWAVENGITAGVDATHFNPAGDCNRAQVVTFLYRAYN